MNVKTLSNNKKQPSDIFLQITIDMVIPSKNYKCFWKRKPIKQKRRTIRHDRKLLSKVRKQSLEYVNQMDLVCSGQKGRTKITC